MKNIFNICNEHIGGLLGEAILHHFLKNKLIQLKDDEYYLSEKGYEELELMGIDINNIILTSQKKIKICFEKHHGILYEHIGSFLGKLILEKMLELRWVNKINGNMIELTRNGRDGLQYIGIRLKNNIQAS